MRQALEQMSGSIVCAPMHSAILRDTPGIFAKNAARQHLESDVGTLFTLANAWWSIPQTQSVFFGEEDFETI
jgi:hypothetical protein